MLKTSARRNKAACAAPRALRNAPPRAIPEAAAASAGRSCTLTQSGTPFVNRASPANATAPSIGQNAMTASNPSSLNRSDRASESRYDPSIKSLCPADRGFLGMNIPNRSTATPWSRDRSTFNPFRPLLSRHSG